MRLSPSLVLALLLLSPGAAIAKPINTTPTPLPETRDPCALFTEDATYISQTLIMQLEHRRVDLQVPVEFFEYPRPRKTGYTDTAQLFRVEIGSFVPVTRAEMVKRNEEGLWNWMTFVIADHIDLERLAIYRVKRLVKNEGGDTNLAPYARSAGPFGLTVALTPGKQPTLGFRTNTYLSQRDDGVLDSVISCSVQGSVPNPGCQHWFRAAGMDVELDYRRSELPNWHALQEDATKFLTCATTSKS